MKKTRFICFCLALWMCILAYPAVASDSPAYKQLISEKPVHIKNVTVDGLYGFYKNASVKEIFSLKENNFTKGIVNVGGVPTECYVYMRTFSITDISNYTTEEAKALADTMFAEVKSILSSTYVKCIARSYSISVSGTADKENNTYKSYTVRFIIAAGESNEERAEVLSSLVRPTVSLWEGLTEGEKFIKLNEFLLNGQFSYDMEFVNRSSVYAFITGKKGVCEEYAGLTALFLDEMGYENKLITGTVGTTKHVWNLVYINGRPYHLDILHNGPVDENGIHTQITRDFLLVSTDVAAINRIPDEKYRDECEKAVYNYVFEGAPTQIPSEFFHVENGMMSRIPLSSSVGYIKTLLALDGRFFTFTDKDGAVLSDSSIVGSGCTLTLDVNGYVLQTLTLCVSGDADGDGQITDSDINIIKSIILRKDAESSQRYSPFCDINEDGAVTVSDFFTFSKLKDSIVTYHG